MLQVITVRTGNVSTYLADRKKGPITSDLFKTRPFFHLDPFLFIFCFFVPSTFTLGSIQGNYALKFFYISYISFRDLGYMWLEVKVNIDYIWTIGYIYHLVILICIDKQEATTIVEFVV